MRRLFRWAFRGFLLLIVLVVALLLSLDSIARAVAERRIRAETGLEARIGSLSLGLLSPTLTMENLRIYNSPEFGGSPLLEVGEFHLEYDRQELWAGRLRCRLVRVDLRELNLVVSQPGRINLALPVGGSPPLPSRLPRKIAGLRFLGIDTLNLSLGRITALRMRDPKTVRELNARLRHRILTGIVSEEDLWFKLGVVVLEQNGGVSLFEFLSKS